MFLTSARLALLSLLTAGLLLAGCGNGGQTTRPPGQTSEPPPVSASPDTARQPADTTASTDTAQTRSPRAPVEDDGSLESWTAGIVSRDHSVTGVATLRAVRTGLHDDFDRVVFEFEGTELPGYHLEYIDKPVRQCGSGNVVEVAGDGWLEVRMTPSQAHTEAGEPTISARERMLDMPILKEMELTCDFEAYVTWVLGTSSPNRYRITELSDPARLVVDVRHR